MSVQSLSIRNSTQAVSYADILPSQSTGNTATDFVERLNQSTATPDQHLVHLLSLVVFEPYIKLGLSEWNNRISAVRGLGDIQTTATSILSSVTAYMQAVTAKNNIDDYQNIVTQLSKAIQTANTVDIAPIAKIVAYDYMGLAYNKIAGFLPKDSDEQKQALISAAGALQQCRDLAKLYDDPQLRLWEGFAGFNLARVNHQLGETVWQAQLQSAIEVRQSWANSTLTIPDSIQTGFAAEAHYAIATMASLDSTMSPEKVLEDYQVFDSWRDSLGTEVVPAGAAGSLWEKTLENRGIPIPKRSPAKVLKAGVTGQLP